jgi:hypothetical protein
VKTQLIDYINSIYTGEIRENFTIDNVTTDVYIPEKKIAFDFNILEKNSDQFIENDHHLLKTEHFENRGIKLIHIWEDEWVHKDQILKSQIINWLGMTPNKIWARRCSVREVSSREAGNFLEENHIQGTVGSSLKIGLYLGDKLVSLMTFDHNDGRFKKEGDFWNLSRFCNIKNYNVVGGFSKLLKWFLKNKKPKTIISYADRCWSFGDIYIKHNFELVNKSKSDYKYIQGGIRMHKSNFKKERLGIKGLPITEREHTKKLGIHRIYDCGKIKFKLEII